MEYMNGRKVWYFPDGELPPPGDEPMKGHESIVVLNDNSCPANIRMSLYFTDREPVREVEVTVMPERVRCIRMDNEADLKGVVIPRETQYAIRLESDVPIVVQYGRLDTRQVKMAFYTTSGYSF